MKFGIIPAKLGGEIAAGRKGSHSVARSFLKQKSENRRQNTGEKMNGATPAQGF